MQKFGQKTKGPQRFAQTMTRQRFLDLLQEKWINDNLLTSPVAVEDLLDDAATIGCPGASDAYFSFLFQALKKVIPVDRGVKKGTKRGTYNRRKTYLGR